MIWKPACCQIGRAVTVLIAGSAGIGDPVDVRGGDVTLAALEGRA
jgi:hypothetical protein